jgi:adenine-specific DNA-methyltransferase
MPTFNKNFVVYKEELLNRRECRSWQINYFHLHRPRDEKFFIEWEKIVCWTRVVSPSFYYTDDEYYWSRALNFIKTDRIDLKYLTAILNSTLSYFWLKNKGKLLWDLLQVDKSHLLNIPIKNVEVSQYKPVTVAVDKIIERKRNNSDADTTDLEAQIDQMVYDLYGLSPEEIAVVEWEVK